MNILLTGNIFHDYEYDFCDALREMGHDVDLVFNNIHGPYHPKYLPSIPNWVKYGFLPHKLNINYFFDKSISDYNQRLKKMIGQRAYDLMLVIGGKTIYPDVLESFKNRKVLWFLDSLTRYEEVLQKVPLFDEVFLFEPTDKAVIMLRFNKISHFLATGFNPKYHQRSDTEKRFDFSFVGSYYPKREVFLAQLEQLTDSLAIYGDFFRAKSSFVKASVKKYSLARSKANGLYNHTKINVNIHHDQSREGLAPRTFEIIGSGGFQLVERQKVALEYFEEDTDMAFYDGQEEFLSKAAFYLKNDSLREKIALQAYEKARKFHTWRNRFEEMFQIVRL